jgi:hypothetical protein
MYYEYGGIDRFGDAIVCSTLLDKVSADTVVRYHAPTLIKKYADGVCENHEGIQPWWSATCIDLHRSGVSEASQ